MITVNKIFFSVLILIQLLILSISCDCGQPGEPHRGYVSGHMKRGSSYIWISQWKGAIPEGTDIGYECHDTRVFNDKQPIFTNRRYCKDGKWRGRITHCGESLIDRLLKKRLVTAVL
jgi:hypothetical protein